MFRRAFDEQKKIFGPLSATTDDPDPLPFVKASEYRKVSTGISAIEIYATKARRMIDLPLGKLKNYLKNKLLDPPLILRTAESLVILDTKIQDTEVSTHTTSTMC